MSRVRDIANILSGGSSAIATDAEVAIVSSQIPSNMAGKNFVINGGFNVWQRGTSFTTDSGGNWSQYTADRWIAYAYYPGYSATQTITQESNLSHVPTGSKHSLKAVVATAHADQNPRRMAINYTIENQDAILLAGKTVTLSFQMKGIANIDSVQCVVGYNPAGGRVSAPMSETQIINQSRSISPSVFTLVSYTFTAPSQSTLTSSGTIGFTLYYQKSNGTAEQVGDGIYLGNVQLEIGSVVTPFSRAGGTIQGELAKCQRYYFAAGWKTGKYPNSYQYSSPYFFKVPMRVSPTITYSDAVGNVSKMSTYAANDARTDNVSPLTVAADTNALVIVPNDNGTGATSPAMSISFTVSAEL